MKPFTPNAVSAGSCQMTRYLIPAAVALALAAGGLSGCEKKVSETAREQARSVTVVSVQPREIQGGLVASGSLIPREDTAIFPQITGYRVAQVLVDEGMPVRAGQPLARLDDTLLRAQLEQQIALAKQQKAAAERADEEAARVKGLDTKGILAQEQIDQRRFAATAADAQAAAQVAAVHDVETREALMTLRSPYDGLVIERNVRPGDMSATAAANPWFRIAKDSQVELAADVGEESLDKMRIGMPVQVTLADGAKVMGRIRLVSPRVDATTKLGRVRIALPVRADIRAGGFASGAFLGFTRSTLSVPETAVRYDANGAAVMVVGADDRVSRVPVTTGQRGGGFVELLSGPPAGARVVEKAGAMLVPGDVVRPVSATPVSPA
jgi:HlyD family secretion protein